MLLTVLFYADPRNGLDFSNMEPKSYDEWSVRYSKKRRLQLTSARNEYMKHRQLTKESKAIKCFLKNETSAKQTCPRNISPVSDTVLSIGGPYFSAIDDRLHDCPRMVKGQMVGKRNFKTENYRYYVEGDFSRFDSTQSHLVMMSVNHTLYNIAFQDPDFDQIVVNQLLAVGKTNSGVRYRTDGRKSGDSDTSSGNSLINLFTIWLSLVNVPAEDWDCVVEGDDSLISTNNPDVTTYLTVVNTLGFGLKSDMYLTLEDTSFCGRHLVEYHGKVSEMCDINRTLTKFNITTSSQPNLKALLLAKAMSYYQTDKGTPIIGTLCSVLIRLLLREVNNADLMRALRSTERATRLHRTGRYVRNYKWGVFTPSPAARAHVCTRSGISIREQIAIESEYLSWLQLGYIPDKISRVGMASDVIENGDNIVEYRSASDVYH